MWRRRSVTNLSRAFEIRMLRLRAIVVFLEEVGNQLRSEGETQSLIQREWDRT